uniref:Uncharacterized protein n=1 Tax=Ixodes ricinus TaxID=34613 RepID=A0A0K8RJE1_IXORI
MQFLQPKSLFRINMVTSAALKLCRSLELAALEKCIKKSKIGHLDVFFFAKTHRTGLPFRTIVAENGAWQKLVSGNLQKHPGAIELLDPVFVLKLQALV